MYRVLGTRPDPGRTNAAEGVLGRCPEIVQDLVQLINVAETNSGIISNGRSPHVRE